MKEQPFFFGAEDNYLFGILHLPDAGSQKTAFVFSHPFGEEKLWAHRVYVSLARRLALLGYPVLRFDFTGHGDSMGEFADSDVNSRLADISKAVEHILSVAEVNSVALFGLRFGAALAAMAADMDSRVSSLILWQPIVDGEQYMQEILRSNLSTQMTVFGKVKSNRNELVDSMRAGEPVNVDGYHLTGRMYDQAAQIHLDQRRLLRPLPALVLQLSTREDSQENPKFKALASQYAPGQLETVKEDPFWREIRRWYSLAANAQEATLRWIEVNSV